MVKKYFLFIMMYSLISCFQLQAQSLKQVADSLYSDDEIVDITIRLGQGGFKDKRSSIGKLGGGQLTMDIKHHNYPIAISISSEYYTNSADPTHSYEITHLFSMNLLYMKRFSKIRRVNWFAGGGLGLLKVPYVNDNPKDIESGMMYNLEAGANIHLFWKIGFYGMYKYLYAKKDVHNTKVIDFSEHIGLFGITFNFSL